MSIIVLIISYYEFEPEPNDAFDSFNTQFPIMLFSLNHISNIHFTSLEHINFAHFK